MTITGSRSFPAILMALGVCGALGGCADGVEVQGKLADMLGISSAALAAKSAEPKMAVRPGLVLPPDTNRLPEPGSGGTEDGASLASVADPDRLKAQNATERARLHKAYCSGEMTWKDRLNNPDSRPSSPYGPCTSIGGMLNQN